MQAVVEMDENRMPPEHAAMTPRMRRDDPSLRDDPLVRQGDASMLKHPVSAPMPPLEAKSPAAGHQGGTSASDEIVIDVIVAYTKKNPLMALGIAAAAGALVYAAIKALTPSRD